MSRPAVPAPPLPPWGVRYAFGLAQRLEEATRPSVMRGGTILMAHGVAPSRRELDQPNLEISSESLRSYIEAELRVGHTFRPVGDLGKCSSRETRFLTFDDALHDVLDNAIPILADYGIPFSLFVPTDLLGQPGFLNEDELRELARDGLCTIGSHSVSHPMFRSLGRDAVIHELGASRAHLESTIGRPVSDFAFPYGSRLACSRSAIRLASAVYERTYSTIGSSPSLRAAARGSFLPRKNLSESTWSRLVA